MMIVATRKSLLGEDISPPDKIRLSTRFNTSVLLSSPLFQPPAMMTFWPILAHPGHLFLLVLSLPAYLQPSMLVGPAMAASNSRMWSPYMARKLVGVMVTTQGQSISTCRGRAGPACHCI